MQRRTRSMRRSVIALFAVSILLSLVLLMGYEVAISSYYRGENNFLTALLKPGPSLARSTMSSDKLFRAYNALLNEGIEAALDPGRLAALGEKASPLVIVLRRDGEVTYASRRLGAEDLASLPAYGSLEQSPAPEEEEVLYYAIRQFDFRSPSGEEVSFFILRPPTNHQAHLPYPRQLGLLAALLLLAADGAVGVYFTIRITTSLRRLEDAARRMGSGDLATPVKADMPFSELASAFLVLESMRTEISALLSRERAREQERRELIANLSHDLRTPLSALRGYVDGLREGIADTPEKADRYLAVIHEKAGVLERMIGEILLLSTLDEDGAPSQRVALDLGEFLEGGLEELRLAYESRGAAFDLDLKDAPHLLVLVDPGQLQRVVENVVANALRHGGAESPRIRFRVAAAGAGATLTIEDNGRGVAPEDLERIFERFRRLDPERSGGGSGLGLAIARKLIEANGGTIAGGASPLGGLAVTITLEGGRA